jgi:hypothetical protein
VHIQKIICQNFSSYKGILVTEINGSGMSTREDITEMFKISIHDIWVSQTSHLLDERSQINQDIKEIKEKIAYMVELVSSKKIDPEDFIDSKASNTVSWKYLTVSLMN